MQWRGHFVYMNINEMLNWEAGGKVQIRKGHHFLLADAWCSAAQYSTASMQYTNADPAALAITNKGLNMEELRVALCQRVVVKRFQWYPKKANFPLSGGSSALNSSSWCNSSSTWQTNYLRWGCQHCNNIAVIPWPSVLCCLSPVFSFGLSIVI